MRLLLGACLLFAALPGTAGTYFHVQQGARAGGYGSKAASDPSLLFDFYPSNPAALPSIDRLSESLCINGTCVAPTCRYRGADATTSTWPAWGYGPTLSIVDAGADVTPGVMTPLLGANDTAVTFPGSGDYFAAPDNTTCQVDDEDFCVVALGRTGAGGNFVFGATKASSAATAPGWALDSNATVNGRVLLADGTNGAQLNVVALDGNEWTLLVACMDRNENSTNGAASYVDGERSDTVNPAAVTGSAIGGEFTLGALEGGASRAEGSLLYFALYKRDVWFAGGAQNLTDFDSAAFSEAAKLFAMVPRLARGSSTPTVIDRESPSFVSRCDSGVVTMLPVGDDWPLVRKHCSGFTGYRAEPPVTNMLLQSRNLGTSWTKLDAGDTIGGSLATPYGTTSTTAGLIADATDGDHGVSQVTGNLSALPWTCSAIAKAGAVSWAYLSDDTVANATGYFDLSTCTKGTEGAGLTHAHAQSLGNGLCRVGITFTATVAAHTIKAQCAEGNGDKSFAGDGSDVSCYLTDLQCEQARLPTPLVPTTTATVARQGDRLDYSPTSNINLSQGSIVCEALLDDYDSSTGGFIGAANGTTAWVYAGSTVNVSRCTTRNAGATTADVLSSTDTSSGVPHTLACSYQASDVRIWINGSPEGSPNLSAAMPASATLIRVGDIPYATSAQPSASISRCRIYSRPGVTQ